MEDAGGTESAGDTENVGGIENALVDVTNFSNTPALVEYVPRNADAARDAREQGWNVPQPYDYQNYERKETGDWAGVAARYEWKDEYGDVGPPNAELEKELFESEFIPRVGLHLEEYGDPFLIDCRVCYLTNHLE